MAETKKTPATKTTAAKKPAVAKKAAATTRKAATKKTVEKQPQAPLHIGIVQRDPWLEPFEDAIRGRHDHAEWMINHLTNNGKMTLSDFATGYMYYGLQRNADGGWVFREWAPNATDIYLIGDFNNWTPTQKYRLKKSKNGQDWELKLPKTAMKHGDLYKMFVKWDGGQGERIPAWVRRVVQDDETKVFSAQVWAPEEEYKWKKKTFKPSVDPLLIYECHVGMAQDAEKVGSYTEFREKVLPRVIKAGYNCIQVMAIQEHPYYGSFGYHVSNFFAPSSRFGTPEELKALIDEAHKNGIAVIMDLVHSHAVKNEVEGLGNLCGDPCQYFYQGDRREHNQWDSLCFDYGKDQVMHFLLSNCKYWLDEFHFDGFRFDGVTSMLYYNHGLGVDFGSYGDYFNGGQDDNALCYLALANKVIHEVNKNAITIAEEMSGMPGLAAKFEDGGLGFDYRLAMGLPDYWIKMIKEKRDEQWNPRDIFWEMTNRRADEKTISYAESHDQALVGDKTIIFRLIDADMYWHFKKGDENDCARRGIALHKMIRLVTASTMGGGYLNFMGNEWGHPEWIDFPREGNGWSCKYARRQWNLVDNKELCYHWLGDFDRKMMEVIHSEKKFNLTPVREIWVNEGDQVMAFMRGDLLFVFNFSPTRSFTDYGFLVPLGSYSVVLNTDSKDYGGFGFADDSVSHLTNYDPAYVGDKKEWLKLYIPARSAVVLRKN
ncbi:MAG: alpha amylase C-terminal domain-containing protein [Prevotella sp.]|nr:alpha amylase C-terminal domain-containing protein [Prevotella sp.]